MGRVSYFKLIVYMASLADQIEQAYKKDKKLDVDELFAISLAIAKEFGLEVDNKGVSAIQEFMKAINTIGEDKILTGTEILEIGKIITSVYGIKLDLSDIKRV